MEQNKRARKCSATQNFMRFLEDMFHSMPRSGPKPSVQSILFFNFFFTRHIHNVGAPSHREVIPKKRQNYSSSGPVSVVRENQRGECSANRKRSQQALT